MKKGIFNLVTMVLILIIVFSIKGTAYSMEKTATANDQIMDSYYRALEKEYTDNIKSIANQMGYLNAGIMLTKVVDETGKRVYTLSMHHKSFGRNTEKDEEFINDIKAMDIMIEDASILIETTN